jgi:hypothetical protein
MEIEKVGRWEAFDCGFRIAECGMVKQRTEDRSQRSDVRGQQAEGVKSGMRKWECGMWNLKREGERTDN